MVSSEGDSWRVHKADMCSSSKARTAASLLRPDEAPAFAGPDLGRLASLMVAPEEGSWRVDEVTVSSSRSRRTDRFVCRDALGSSGQSMGFLAPVPQDAVVYGSGESAVILTRVRAP